MVSAETNAGKVSDGFKKLSDTLINSIAKSAIHPELKVMQIGARRVHRHKRQTGKLERSIKITRRPDGGMLYADDSQAVYAKFVHMGQRSWAPDEYIFDSFKRNERHLEQSIDKAIDLAFKKAGI